MEREEKSTNSADLIEQIVSNVIGFSQSNGNLLNKYNDEFYLNYFDRLKIDETMKKLQSHQKQLEVPEFVRLFLGSITHSPEETLYLTISLINLHKKVMEETSNENGVKFADFTAFLCSKISEGDPDLVIPMKEIAPDKIVPDVGRVRDIDINPPPILSKVENQKPKITKDKNKKDKKLDEKKPLAKFIYSSSLDSIITLGRLSSSITLYNPLTLNVQVKIIPNACKLMAKDVAILSMAYCERDNRIGCIINNIGMTFWEASDNFGTQKILGINKPEYDPKLCGDKIYYLNLFQEWVTTDRDVIMFWDLKEEIITKSIKRPNASTVNDISEINHLRGLLVSYNSNTLPEQKFLVLYQDFKQVSKLALGNPGCHSLCYNPSTQLVISLGYQSIVSVYHIDVKTFDINLIAELKAHTSILTCVCNIPDTSMVVSGDDIGFVKIWDLNYMRCLQSIKIAKNIQQISCNQTHLIYADSRLNMIPMDSKKLPKEIASEKCQQVYGVYHFFRKEDGSLWIITRKDARQIRLSDGRTKNILVVCCSEEQVSAAAELFNGFLIGTSKGQLYKYAFNGEKKWRIMAHEGQVRTINVDFENHLICTTGSDNNLIMWAEKAILDEENIRKRINFHQKDISMVEICPYANLLLVSSSNDNSLTIWSYDSIKLAYIIDFHAPISTAKIFADKDVIIVSTTDGQLHILKYIKKDTKFRLKLCGVISLQDMNIPGLVNDMGESDNCLMYISELEQCQDSNLIFGCTPKGCIFCFQPENFYPNPNYKREYEPLPSIKRPNRQSYDHEILKNQFIRCSSEALLDQGPQNFETVWINKIHKDTIIFQSLLSLQKKYICTQCTDGYFRIVQLANGDIVCSRKITYPLPIQWDIDTENYGDLKNQIHQAISVLDSILKTYAYQLTMKEQKSLNLTEFMQKMIICCYFRKKNMEKAQIMSNQYTAADLKGIYPKSPTLKALQAYKRLQLIKKQNQHDVSQMATTETGQYQTTALQKQSIRHYLQPNYLPKLLNKGINQPVQFKGGQHMKKLQNILNGVNKRTKKEIEKGKQKNDKQNNRTQKSLVYKSLQKSLLDHSFNRYERSTLISSKYSEVKDMSVKNILSDINNKLKHCKKGRSSLFTHS